MTVQTQNRPQPEDPKAQRWLKKLTESRHGLLLIGAASFAEALFVPIPLELILIPYMLVERRRVWLIAAIVTLACLLGATVGYWIGAMAFDAVAPWLADTFGWGEAFESFRQRMQTHGFWAVLMVGITPVPFQVAMLTAGAAGYSFVLFLLASAIARSIRYFGLALLVALFGDRALEIWQRHKVPVAIAITVLVVGIWLASWWIGKAG